MLPDFHFELKEIDGAVFEIDCKPMTVENEVDDMGGTCLR